MKIKKILSLILAAAMLCGIFCVGTGAEASADDTIDALDFVLDDYLWLAEWCGGYFPEGGAPSIETVYQRFMWDVSDYEEYCVEMDEYGFGTYHIPADIYENELVFTAFAKTDAMLEMLHSSDLYKTDKDEPYYAILVGGGFGGPLPVPVTQGYTVRDDGLIEAYAYLAEYIGFDEEWNTIDYVPAEGDVEGEDYIVIGVTTYDYDEATDTYKDGFKYAPAKIVGVIRSVVELDVEEWTAVYHSYEQIDKSLIPSFDDMIIPEESKDVAYVGGAFMEIDRTTFGDGVTVYGEEYWDDPDVDGEEFDTARELLNEYGELGGLYEFTAMKDGAEVQPNGKVAVSFMLPYDFSPDCKVYRIAEYGVEALETAIDPDSYDPTILYATAELEHFSKYAVVGYRYGETNGDGVVNLADVTNMLKSIAKWNIELNEITADANGDGTVNILDVSLILRYIAGWDVSFGTDYKPEPEPEPEPSPDIPEVPGMEIDENGVLVKYTGTETEVVIPEGVTAIGDDAFDDSDITSVTIPGSVTSIGEDAFFLCDKLATINISEGVKEIGNYAFAYCPVTIVDLPDSVTMVGDEAFFRCPNIAEIKLSENLVSIGDNAFTGCYKKVDIPASLTSIGYNAFAGSEDFTEFNVAEDNPVYKSVDGVLFSKDGKTVIRYPQGKADTEYTVPEGVTAIEDGAFSYSKSLTWVVLPDGLKTIGGGAFAYCDNLLTATIPNTVTEIGVNVFSNCKRLSSVTLSDSLTVIPRGTFLYCWELIDVEIPDGVTTIGESAFAHCTSLRNVVVPDSVTIIVDSAFSGFGVCPDLTIWCSETSAIYEYAGNHKIPCYTYLS